VSYLTWIVLVGTSLLGATAGVLGSFAVLRRRALTGDLLAHAALPGLCIAFLVLGQRDFLGMLIGAFVTGLLGIAATTLFVRWTRTKEDAAIGIVLSTFFGAGIVLSSVIQNRSDVGAKAGLESYIYGQAAGMVLRDVYVIAAVAAVSLLVVTLLYKEFKLLSFDPQFARAQGWPTFALDMTLMSTLALVTVTGLPAVGVILMAAMLITPGAAARFWTSRLGPMLVLSGVFGAVSAAVGTLLSAGVVEDWLGFDPLAFGPTRTNLPTGPLIVLSSTLVFLFSVAFAPRQGVVARAWAEARMRLKTAHENLLRTMYELSEGDLPGRPSVSLDRVLERRAWSPGWARWMLWRAKRQGLVKSAPDGFRLTEAGVDRAARLVRTHRLWELFLIQGAHIAPDHVDRDADAIEHLLGPEVIEALERQLTAAERLPEPRETVPVSPHALSAEERR